MLVWSFNLKPLKGTWSVVFQTNVCDGRTDNRPSPNFTEGDNNGPISNQPLSPCHCNCLNLIKTTTPLPQQFVSTGNWNRVHSDFTVVIYQQLKTAHRVNRNILSNAPSGADGKVGLALGTVGLQRDWRITLPLSNKGLKRSCTTTSRDENVWITSSSGLAKCIDWRLGSNTHGSLRAGKKAHVYPANWRPFNWVLECSRIRKTNRQRQ